MKIGKANLEIKVEGCCDCSTKWSSGWTIARVLAVTIDGGKPFNVSVHRCDDCVAKLKNENALTNTPEFNLQ